MNEDINSQLRVLIQQLLGMELNSVRNADQNKPYTGDNIAIMQLVDFNPYGWSGDQSTGEATFNIDFFGRDAPELASTLASAMQSHWATHKLDELNLGFVEVANVTNLTALESETTIRYRARLIMNYTKGIYSVPPEVDDPADIEQVTINTIIER